MAAAASAATMPLPPRASEKGHEQRQRVDRKADQKRAAQEYSDNYQGKADQHGVLLEAKGKRRALHLHHSAMCRKSVAEMHHGWSSRWTSIQAVQCDLARSGSKQGISANDAALPVFVRRAASAPRLGPGPRTKLPDHQCQGRVDNKAGGISELYLSPEKKFS